MRGHGWWEALLGLLFPEPQHCLLCRHNFIDNPEEAVCASCLAQVPECAPPLCRVCGRERSERRVCSDCRRRSETFFLCACSYGPYRGRLRELILVVKKDRKKGLLPFLVGYLEEVWALQLADKGIDVLVPVPMAEERRRERGFNQAALLAQQLGSRVQVPVCEALVWRGERRSQVARNREQRFEGMEKQIGLSLLSTEVQGRVVCLVDDVYTTGSTANACAQKLHEAGARVVYVLTVAR